MNKIFQFLSPPVIVIIASCGNAHGAEALAAAPIGQPGAARATKAPDPQVQQVQQVQQVDIVSSRTDERRQASTFRQTLVAADLARYGDTSVLDVLRRQPGIAVSGVPGRKGGELSMRGLGSGYVRILLNGDPAPPNFSLDSLSPNIVERIDILPVPMVELGTQAIAGTINIILKRNTGKRERQLKAGIYHDADRTSPQASGTYSDQRDTLSWLVAASLRRLSGDETFITHIDGVDAGVPISRRLAQLNQDRGWNWSIAPRISKQLGGNDSLALESYVSAIGYDSVGHDRTSFLQGPSTPFANDRYTSSGTSLTIRTNLTWLQKLGESGKLEAKVGSTYSKDHAESAIKYVDLNDILSNRQDTRKDDRNRSATASAKLSTSYMDKHVFVAGAEVQRDRDDLNRANLIDSLSQLGAAGSVFDVHSRRYALYAQDEWDIAPRWSVYLGMRWERVELNSANNLGQQWKFGQGMSSPVLQTVWRLPDTKSDQLRLGLARTWRIPPGASLMAGRTVSNVHDVSRPDTSGNPTLRPERALGLDAAYEHYLSQDGMVGVGLFVRRIEDVTLTQTALENGRWVAKPVNSGRALARGITLESKFKLPQLIAVAAPIDMRASLSRTWSAIDAVPGPSNRIGGEAPLSVRIGGDVSFKTAPLSAGATLAYIRNGEVRSSRFESSAQSNKRLLETYLLWRIQPKVQLRLSASNLLHEDDLKRASYFSATLSQSKTLTATTYTVVRAILELKL